MTIRKLVSFIFAFILSACSTSSSNTNDASIDDQNLSFVDTSDQNDLGSMDTIVDASQADSTQRDFELTGPIVWTTSAMLERAYQGMIDQRFPYAAAWAQLKKVADSLITTSLTPYQGPDYGLYFSTGRYQAQCLRHLAVAYHLSMDTRYRDKAITILMDWVTDGEVNTSPASDVPHAAGLVVGRVMSIFADSYALLHHALDLSQRTRVEAWMQAKITTIKKSRQIWESGSFESFEPPFLGEQYFNNHLGAQTMGLLAIGYATSDRQIVLDELRGATNSRDFETLFAGVILMSKDDLYQGDPTLTNNAPTALDGEIYDRYRIIENKGLHYSQLHLRFLTLMALMAKNNDDGDYFSYTASGGEQLLLSYQFYAPFGISGRSSEQSGYYIDSPIEWDLIGNCEIAHLFYPNNDLINELLEHRNRIRSDYESFGYTAALLFAPGTLNDMQANWTFDRVGQRSGWIARTAVTLSLDNGSLAATMTGIDPGILSPEDLQISAQPTQELYLSLRNDASTDDLQVFFTTDSDTIFTSTKKFTVKLPAVDGQFHDIRIAVGQHQAWTGKIQQLRIDPAIQATSGTVYFDTIRIE